MSESVSDSVSVSDSDSVSEPVDVEDEALDRELVASLLDSLVVEEDGSLPSLEYSSTALLPLLSLPEERLLLRFIESDFLLGFSLGTSSSVIL